MIIGAIIILIISLLVAFCAIWPTAGLYAVVFFAPFLGLVVDFSSYQWSSGMPVLNGINAPLADILVLFLFIGVVIRGLARWWQGKAHPRDIMPILQGTGFLYFAPFLLAGLLSLLNVDPLDTGLSLKYLLRPILYFYFMWVFLPYALITTAKTLKRVFYVMLSSAFVAALIGFASLANQGIFSFGFRIRPVEFLGLAPLLLNHNILAEVLVAAAPLAFYFFYKSRGKAKKWFFLLLVMITSAGLLTFSRGAWIAFALEVAIYAWGRRLLSYYSRLKEEPAEARRESRRAWWFLIPLIAPFVLYMAIFSFGPIARSSNQGRASLSGIAWTYFKFYPVIGNGAGSFVAIVEETKDFVNDYGDALDSHGALQKIMTEEGMVGIIGFLIFAGWVTRRLYLNIVKANGNTEMLLLLLFVSVTGMFAYELFNTSYYNAHLWLPVGVALAAGNVLNKRSQDSALGGQNTVLVI